MTIYLKARFINRAGANNDSRLQMFKMKICNLKINKCNYY